MLVAVTREPTTRPTGGPRSLARNTDIRPSKTTRTVRASITPTIPIRSAPALAEPNTSTPIGTPMSPATAIGATSRQGSWLLVWATIRPKTARVHVLITTTTVWGSSTSSISGLAASARPNPTVLATVEPANTARAAMAT